MTGLLRVIRFNWTQYLAAVAVLAVVGILAALPFVGDWDLYGWFMAAGIGWVTIASLIATWWIYDISQLTKWTWLIEHFKEHPKRWIHIHCGYDQPANALNEFFGAERGTHVDIYDADAMDEASIRRARNGTWSDATSVNAAATKLPFGDQEIDAVFILMSAHEIRDTDQRERFFDEIERILALDGTVILVEHVRDTANAIVYGPGVLHFFGAKEWRRLAAHSGLDWKEERITPFVRTWTMRRTLTHQNRLEVSHALH